MTAIGNAVDGVVRPSAHIAGLGVGLLLGGAALVLAAVLPSQSAEAVPIDPALSITGQVTFDGVFSFVDGNASQSGTMVLISGGTASQSTISGTTVTGADPLAGALTETGDSVGATGSIAGGPADGDENLLGIDLTIDVNNTSASDPFKVTFKVLFDNVVDSNGPDAFAESEFTVDDPSNLEVFFTDITSDTLFGDDKNGVALGTFGEQVTDMGMATFDVVFSPLAMGTITAFFTMEGGAFEPESGHSGELSAFLRIESVMNQGTPTPVPEPGTLALFGAGLGAMILIVRRRRLPEAAGPTAETPVT